MWGVAAGSWVGVEGGVGVGRGGRVLLRVLLAGGRGEALGRRTAGVQPAVG